MYDLRQWDRKGDDTVEKGGLSQYLTPREGPAWVKRRPSSSKTRCWCRWVSAKFVDSGRYRFPFPHTSCLLFSHEIGWFV